MIDPKQRAAELEKASVDSAREGLKALLLLNGGACIALLAFIANLAGNDKIDWGTYFVVKAAMRSLAWFAVGAGLSVLTWFFAYYSNQSYATSIIQGKERAWSVGSLLANIGAFLALLSLMSFALGVFSIWGSASR
ncbi:hypothetical protein [Rhizobium sp. K102]|uniref:hypothetical protein n=1 Tax=Rhizobium sp. K102 TaxID=2918527 RepID=UPI001EFC2549|nr:hypothetical protein [Rhizobium sp. K102]ULR43642.1 hypothetical protein MHI61_21040 [Rhizobium sp. K102]